MNLLFPALLAGCQEYGVQVIDLPDPTPPDTSEPVWVETGDTRPPSDSAPPPACGDGPWPPGQAAVDETCVFEPVTGTFRPVVEWWISAFDAFPTYISSTGTPSVGRVTDDDVPDIAFTSFDWDVDYSGVLRLVSGDGTRVHWSVGDTALDGLTYHPYGLSGTAMADVDRDGDVEIAVLVSSGTGDDGPCHPGMYDHEGSLLWVSTARSTPCGGYAPAFGDLEGDGVAEVIFGRDFLDAATGATVGAGSYGYGYGSNYSNSGAHAFPVDLDLDGVQEVVTGSSLYNPDGSLRCYTGYADGYPAVADMDGDGLGEVVVTGNGWVRIFEDDCWLADQWEIVDGGYGGPATLADYDGDGQPEIGVASYAMYSVFEADGTLLWERSTTDISSSSTGSSVYDFDGDGYAEVVYADEEELWIYAGIDGLVRLRDSTHLSGTVNEYPVIVDVDGDGEVEIVVMDRVGLFVVGDYDHGWVPGRQVWNQASYNIVNIQDDLTVPAVPECNWPTHNNFRSGDIVPAFASAAPDVVPLLVETCTVECDQGILQVVVQVGNGGLARVEPGIALALYDGDGALLGQGQTATAMPSGGASEALLFRVDASVQSLTLVVDDDGTGQGALTECDEGDNALVINGELCP